MMRALTVWFLLAALCAACVRETASEKAPLPVTVQPVAAVAGPVAASASRYTAVLAAREQVSLAFKVPGYVDFIDPAALDKGRRVAKGQVLARVRESDYKAKLAQARSTLAEAQASLELARSDQERNARLIQGQVISRSEFERTRERLGVAQARVDQARAALEQAEINLRDATLASPLDGVVVRRDVELGALAGQGAAAFVLADLSTVKAVFGMPDTEIARVRPGDTLAVAADALPGREFTGTVTAVSPSADPKSRSFDVELSIPNRDQALKDGMIATVRRDPAGRLPALAAVPLQALSRPAGRAGGGVVGAADGPARSAPGEALAGSVNGVGAGGDGADVRADGPARSEALAGAGAAEVATGYVAYVLAEKDGRAYAQARVVTVAGVAGDMVTLSSGLAPGERVIIRGASLVADGMEVRVIR